MRCRRRARRGCCACAHPSHVIQHVFSHTEPGLLQCGAGAALAAAVLHARTPAMSFSTSLVIKNLACCSAVPAPRVPQLLCMRTLMSTSTVLFNSLLEYHLKLHEMALLQCCAATVLDMAVLHSCTPAVSTSTGPT